MPLCRLCQCSRISRILQRKYSTAQITIPKRIKRTPTSILEALASTVGPDNKYSPDYRFQDDPALTPTSNMERKKMALSLEHGRRAARYFASEWPTLFMYDEDVPRLDVFRPESVPAPTLASLNEQSLMKFIEHRQVNDAMQFYKRLKEANVEISSEAQFSLFELVCYYNHADPPPDESDWPEQVFYSSSLTPDTLTPWQENGMAEELFIELESVDPDRAYSILIAALCKHMQGERAATMFIEMQDKGLKPSYETLEALIIAYFRLDQDAELAWNKVIDSLVYMKDHNMQPKLSTFNKMLQFLTRCKRVPWAKYRALDLFEEMKICGVNPSAGTYKHLFEMFSHLPIRNSLLEILVDRLENDDTLLQMHDDLDRHTLPWLMRVLTDERTQKGQRPPDTLIFRVAEIAQKPEMNLFCESSIINSFYGNLMTWLVMNQPLDSFLEWYNQIVPILFTPNRQLIEKMLFAVEADAAYQHLPRVWQDALTYAMLFTKQTVEALLQLTLNGLMSKEMENNEQLKMELVQVAKNWAHIMDRQYMGDSIVHLQWDVPLLVTAGCICALGGYHDRAWELIGRVEPDIGASDSLTGRKWKNGDKDYTLFGAPDAKTLKLFFEATLQFPQADDLKFEKAMFCIKLASSYRMTQVSEMAQALTHIPLNKTQMKTVQTYIAKGVITNQMW